MALVKMQVGISADSALPRDQLMNTLFFNVNPIAGGAPDYGQLASDLADIYDQNWCSPTQGKYQTQVRAYDAEPLKNVGGKTGAPEATATRRTGMAYAAEWPREVAICLSYFATENVPGKRGRIYLPVAVWQWGTPTGRPAIGQQEAARNMGGFFNNLGGANVDWVLFSPKARATYNITNTWCDNEWDTQRSRGLRATTRSSATL